MTLFKNAGVGLNWGKARAWSSRPSPLKSLLTNVTMEPSVRLALLIPWKSDKTCCEVLEVGLSTKVFGSAKGLAKLTDCRS